MGSSDLFLFLDLETSHLEPERGRILELGAVLTNADLVELGRWECLFPRPASVDMLDTIDMHRTSGLLATLDTPQSEDRSHGRYCAEVSAGERWILGELVEKHAVERRRLQLAGFSIHFDRRWLAAEMPLFHGWLSHRMVDVSTIRELTRRWRPDAEPTEKAHAKHRAIADCEAAIAELGRYRSLLWGAPEEGPVTAIPLGIEVDARELLKWASDGCSCEPARVAHVVEGLLERLGS